MSIKDWIGETTEYDKKLALEVKKPKSWCKSVSAFANTLGGALIFGISNSEEFVGLEDPNEDAEKISEIIKTRLDPIPEFRLRFEQIDKGKVIIILDIFKGEETPYYYSGDGVLEAYVRIGNESVKATATEALPVVRGELALLIVLVINSLGVVLMLYSGSGISAISSVPYAFSEVFSKVSLGVWTDIFQTILVLSLMILRKKFVPQYLLSFIVGAGFGTEIDIHETWVHTLPVTLPLRFVYFFAGYLLISTGIALSNRCKMPIIPTDLFPRELADITKAAYSRIKISYDVICLSVTALLTFVCLGQIRGLGIGTVLAAFTMGKVIGKIGEGMDKKVRFVSIFSK